MVDINELYGIAGKDENNFGILQDMLNAEHVFYSSGTTSPSTVIILFFWKALL